MKAGTGKISRLPRDVRDELNRRLDDGEEGAALLKWLNGRPGTLKVMQEFFAGQPINKQNLSDWRQSGFLEWQRQQEALEIAGRLLEDAEDMEKLATDGPVADRMAELVSVSLGHLLQAALRQPDGPEKTSAVLNSARELIRMRAADRDYERAKRQQQDWQQERDKLDREEAERRRSDLDRARKARLLKPIRIADLRAILTKAYGGTEAAKQRAWFEVGVSHDLPESEWTPPPTPTVAPPAEPASPEHVEKARHESACGEPPCSEPAEGVEAVAGTDPISTKTPPPSFPEFSSQDPDSVGADSRHVTPVQSTPVKASQGQSSISSASQPYILPRRPLPHPD